MRNGDFDISSHFKTDLCIEVDQAAAALQWKTVKKDPIDHLKV